MGYAPWSEGLGIVLHRLHDELPGRPLLICEHGVGTDDDEWRSDVLGESLSIVEEAIADGIDLRGFFHWTGVDNYEWHKGFDVPFGLFTRDREPRGSAELLSGLRVHRADSLGNRRQIEQRTSSRCSLERKHDASNRLVGSSSDVVPREVHDPPAHRLDGRDTPAVALPQQVACRDVRTHRIRRPSRSIGRARSRR